MTDERWGRVRAIFFSALEEEDPASRDALVASLCEGDDALEEIVLSLLARSGKPLLGCD